jgi:hypothetical protein
MSDFDLNKSLWYSMMKLDLHSKHAKASAAEIIKWARNLLRFPPEATIAAELANTETALIEALFAVKTARAEYDQHSKPALVAAE